MVFLSDEVSVVSRICVGRILSECRSYPAFASVVSRSFWTENTLMSVVSRVF